MKRRLFLSLACIFCLFCLSSCFLEEPPKPRSLPRTERFVHSTPADSFGFNFDLKWEHNGIKTVAATDSSVYFSVVDWLFRADHGSSDFTLDKTSFRNRTIQSLEASSSTLYIGTRDGLFQKKDSETGFTPVPGMENRNIESFSVTDTHIYIPRRQFFYRADLSTMQFEELRLPLPLPGSRWVSPYEIMGYSMYKNKLLVLGGHFASVPDYERDYRLFRSRTNGDHFEEGFPSGFPFGLPGMMCVTQSFRIYVATSYGLYISVDEGATFFRSPELLGENIHWLEADGDRVFAATHSGMFFSDRNGAHFQKIDTSDWTHSKGEARQVLVKGERIYWVTNSGLVVGDLPRSLN